MEHINKTIHAYDENGHTYAKKFLEYEIYRKKLEAFSTLYMHSDSDILDIGCGPGQNLRYLIDQGLVHSATGVDLSKKMVSLAKQLVPEAEIYLQNLLHYQPEKTYDVVLAAFCIVHLLKDETLYCISQISTWLNSKGVLYLSFMEGKNPGYESTSFSQESLFFNYYDRNYIIDILQKNGFKILEISEEGYIEPDGSVTADIFIFAEKI